MLPTPPVPTAQEQVNQFVAYTSKDHEARIRQVEVAVIQLSTIATSDKEAREQDKQERSGLREQVTRLERLSYTAIGAFGILMPAVEIYRTFFLKGH